MEYSINLQIRASMNDRENKNCVEMNMKKRIEFIGQAS
jgi:hypothetical protein